MKVTASEKVQVSGQTREECKWMMAELGEFKVNADVSVQIGAASFAVRMVVRDHSGSFIQARTVRKEGEVSVIEAEARGVLEALVWIQELELNMSKVLVECDS